MPKGRGSNERRRSYRQKHPKNKNTEGAHGKLLALGERAVAVAEKRRKERRKVSK